MLCILLLLCCLCQYVTVFCEHLNLLPESHILWVRFPFPIPVPVYENRSQLAYIPLQLECLGQFEDEQIGWYYMNEPIELVGGDSGATFMQASPDQSDSGMYECRSVQTRQTLTVYDVTILRGLWSVRGGLCMLCVGLCTYVRRCTYVCAVQYCTGGGST